MFRFVVTIALAVLAFSSAHAQKFLNKKAPALSFSAAYRDGGKIAYSAPKGKFILVEFWATWCTPCVRNIPHLNELAREFEGKIDFVSISDETAEKVTSFTSAHAISGIVAIDKGRSTFKAFHVQGRPQTFVINDKGIVVYQGEPSGLSAETLRALLSGERINEDRGDGRAGRLGSWGGGQDPVVTGNFDMSSMDYRRYEVIRKSVSAGGGSGWKDWKGEAGVTLLTVTRRDIIAFTNDLPSLHRVIDEMPDSALLWDVIFYRNAGYDMGRAKRDVENMACETFGIKVTQQIRETRVWVPSYDASKLIDATKVADDDPKMKSYELLSEICARIEQKTGKIIDCPRAADELYVDVFELGNKYYFMTGDELINWLEKTAGIKFSSSQGNVKFYVLTAR